MKQRSRRASRGNAGNSIVGTLFQTHSRQVQNFMAFRLRSIDDGQDAAQEVFLKFWRHELEGGMREEATSYLFAVARTGIIETERARAIRAHDLQAPGEELEGQSCTDPDLHDTLHWRRAVSHLLSVVA